MHARLKDVYTTLQALNDAVGELRQYQDDIEEVDVEDVVTLRAESQLLFEKLQKWEDRMEREELMRMCWDCGELVVIEPSAAGHDCPRCGAENVR
jgi:hypothetical protein